MGSFFTKNPTVILALIGLLLSVLNIVNLIKNRKEDHYVSGIPLFGGLFILIGFLLSHHKIWAFLCFTDYSWVMLLFSLVFGGKFNQKKEDNNENEDSKR
ncbi:MAG: hypothetical protein J5956_00650 [Ruminococcus sp.]|nr:hypothetical protein [Ruminococcus sp.]